MMNWTQIPLAHLQKAIKDILEIDVEAGLRPIYKTTFDDGIVIMFDYQTEKGWIFAGAWDENLITKTSEQWLAEIPTAERPVILDPDGWDRKNYDYSFKEELITKKEFDIRVGMSTVRLAPLNQKN